MACGGCSPHRKKHCRRWITAGCTSRTIEAARTLRHVVAGAIPWAVGAWNPRTHAAAMSAENAQGRGGTRTVAIRGWRCAVRSITGPSCRCLRGINTTKQVRKNYLWLPDGHGNVDKLLLSHLRHAAELFANQALIERDDFAHFDYGWLGQPSLALLFVI